MPMQQASSSQWHYWHGRRKPARMRWHVLLLCAHCTWTKSVCLSSALICTTIHGALHGCITHQVREQCSKSVWVNEWASEWVRGRLVKDILRTNIDYYCIRIDNGFQLCSMYACLPRVCQVAVSGHTHTHTHRIQNTVRSVFRSELASFSSAVAAAVCWTIWYTRHCTSAAERTFNHNEACQCMLYITANAIILSKWKKIANELSAHGTLYMKNTFLQQQQQNNNNMNKKLPS